MKLEYISKSMEYDSQGLPMRLRVTLGNIEGGTYPVFLPHSVSNLTNQELFSLAMEVIYEENFPHRFEKEKFLEHERVLEEYKSEIVRVKEDSKAGTEENTEMIKLATLTLNDVLMQIEDLLETKEGEKHEVTGIIEETNRGGATDE